MTKLLKGFLALLIFAIAIVLLNSLSSNIINRENESSTDDGTSIESIIVSDEDFTTNLPIINIDRQGNSIQKDIMTYAIISVFDDPSGENCIKDEPTEVLSCGIKTRGQSSYYNSDRQQYRITFYQDDELKVKADYGLVGLPSASSFVLNAPFFDRSLLRNRLMYSLSEELFEFSPKTNYAEVLVDGEYMGLYLVIEAITNEETRINLFEDLFSYSDDVSFIVRRERSGVEENEISTYGSENEFIGSGLSITYPDGDELTDLKRDYIIKNINKFEKALYSDDFDNPETGYMNYIDVDSFVDYLIINEFSMNLDAGQLSTYTYKNFGDKFKMTVWDFNNTFNNNIWTITPIDTFIFSSDEENSWFSRMLQDRTFVNMVIDRYRQLRKTTLDEDHIFEIIDTSNELISDASVRNFELYGYTFIDSVVKRDSHEERTSNQGEEVEYLKEIISQRLEFLDNNIDRFLDDVIN